MTINIPGLDQGHDRQTGHRLIHWTTAPGGPQTDHRLLPRSLPRLVRG